MANDIKQQAKLTLNKDKQKNIEKKLKKKLAAYS